MHYILCEFFIEDNGFWNRNEGNEAKIFILIFASDYMYCSVKLIFFQGCKWKLNKNSFALVLHLVVINWKLITNNNFKFSQNLSNKSQSLRDADAWSVETNYDR